MNAPLQAGLGLALPLSVATLVVLASAAATASWRRGVLLAALVMGVFIAVSTEMTSLWHGLTATQLPVAWVSLGAAAFAILRQQRKAGRRLPELVVTVGRGWVAYVVLATGLLVLVAVLSPTNNFDSMAYHMTRVAHWAQNQTVDFYASNDERQLYMPPWAEYAVAHLFVLSGSDRWVNLVQVAAMAVSATAASLVAQHTGLSRRGQAITAALTIAIPIGIAEAPTTQTDYVLTMWVVAMLAAARVDRRGPADLRTCLVFATFLGLALLTKPTAYFYATPVLAYFVWRQVRGRVLVRDLVPLVRDAGVVLLVVVALNALSIGRNIATFGSVFGDSTNTPPAASAPRTLVENTVRSLALQLGTPLGATNDVTTRATARGLEVLGMSTSSATSTKPGVTFDVGFSTREDNAGSLAHTVLGLVATLFLLVRRRRSQRLVLLVASMAIAGLLLRSLGQPFSPYLSRYLLTWFALMTPVIAAFLTSLPKRLGSAIAAAVCATSLLWVVAADLRPLAGSTWLHAEGGRPIIGQSRAAMYFAVRPELREPYQRAAAAVHDLGTDDVGVIGGSNAFEYPMWVLLASGPRRAHIQNIDVTGASRSLEVRTRPRTVVCLEGCAGAPAGVTSAQDLGGVWVWLEP